VEKIEDLAEISSFLFADRTGSIGLVLPEGKCPDDGPEPPGQNGQDQVQDMVSLLADEHGFLSAVLAHPSLDIEAFPKR